MRELSEFEENLVEIIHFLAAGSNKHLGLSTREIKRFLITPVKEKQNLTPIELLVKEGKVFINELKTYINEIEE